MAAANFLFSHSIYNICSSLIGYSAATKRIRKGVIIRNILHCTFLLVMILFVNALTACAAPPKKVYIRYDNEVVESETAFIASETEILVPVEFVREALGQNIILNPQSERIYWLSAGQPEFQFENKAIDERLKSGVELNFMAKNIDGHYYVSLTNMEKIFGAEFTYRKDINALVIERDSIFKKNRKLGSAVNSTLPSDTKISLVWDYIKKTSPDLSKEERLNGLNVISPTWFSLATEVGDINNNADIKYVSDAHAKGYKVWALVTNSFNKDLTHKLLSDTKAQDNFINQLLVYSSLYNLDGINVDFENIYDADRDKLSNFIHYLTTTLKQQNLVVSMDVTVPSETPSWSKCYDRKTLGKTVDYMMLMAYDEYWASSPKSGSVATLPWSEKGIERTLSEVPKEKLLLGIPLYMREWLETTDETGNIKAKSRSMSMPAAEELIASKNLPVQWLSEAGQHYVEYTEDDIKHRIWLEDEDSMKLRLGLVQKYKLPGIAAWRKGFEDIKIWDLIASALSTQKPDTPQQLTKNELPPPTKRSKN